MVIVPIRHPGITVTQITMVDGSVEFCQEFFDNALVPVENVVGAINDGWTIATRLLFHERHAVGGSSPYLSVPRLPADDGSEDLGHLAERLGRTDDPGVRELLGEAEMLITVQRQLRGRLARGIASGRIPETRRVDAAALSRKHLDSPGDDRARDRGRGRHRLVPGFGNRRRQGSNSCSGSRAASEAGPRRWPATSSASGCSACHGSPPPTGRCLSARFRGPRDADRVRARRPAATRGRPGCRRRSRDWRRSHRTPRRSPGRGSRTLSRLAAPRGPAGCGRTGRDCREPPSP